MFELVFLLSFTLHNIEEALWLPKWSQYAKKFHPPVAKNEFHFAVLMVTLIGYVLTFLFLATGNTNEIVKYLYLGFLLMMAFNSIFPHLIATIALRRYAPGTLTGLFLNLPIGLYIVFMLYGETLVPYKLLLGFAVITSLILGSLKPLFRMGRKLIDEY
ncbi:MAG TPA: HXXEE domain-containing protein [Spirochaetota bacterium]|nr:HXXEE domain-containing protein [Spirochaetota bacterium]HPJ40380.1 HXXEE domain-containing protein [Spirochaetota bacterium]